MLLLLFCIYIFLSSLYFLSVPSLIFLLFLPVGRDAPGSPTAALSCLSWPRKGTASFPVPLLTDWG